MKDYDYPVEINGLAVQAHFSGKDIEEVFLPLLRYWTGLQQKKKRRVLVMLAAPPGAGKTTLAHFWAQLSRTTPGLCPITAISMDGFHRRQEYLLTHCIRRGDEDVPMVRVKGAPETFDLALLLQRVAKLSSGADCPWPEYNRLTHNPIENAYLVTGDLILLEGNYLLLDAPGWQTLRHYADSTVRITADPEQLRQRLVDRKTASGTARAEAERFVEFSDMANAELCLSHSMPADITLHLTKEGTFRPEEYESFFV